MQEPTLGSVRSDRLDIVYEDGGPRDGTPLLLLHGWPDSPRGWHSVAARLQAVGWRTITPYLRGFGTTRFRSAETIRDGRGVALAKDAIDLADALGLDRFAVAGHDWGARAAYTLAALFPARVTRIAALALPYQPRGTFSLPPFEQARRFWYQWFMTLDDGARAIRADPKGFARLQWETWSPQGWFAPDEFERTAESFDNPDWSTITLHAYRHRWRPEHSDPGYDALQARLAATPLISVPTLMIQGGADACDAPESSEDLEGYFTGGYRRIVLDGVGHFPMRESPDPVAAAILQHLAGG